MMMNDTHTTNKRIFIMDDDPTFCQVLSKAMQKRGFETCIETQLSKAIQTAMAFKPHYMTLDLKLLDGSGLTVIEPLKSYFPDSKIVVLTGYASVATAVDAIKLGATHYLSKPIQADELLTAFNYEPLKDNTSPKHDPLPVEQVEWEHIQRVLTDHHGNVSATARALGMHRRTLQRKLSRLNPGEEDT